MPQAVEAAECSLKIVCLNSKQTGLSDDKSSLPQEKR